MEPQDCVVKTVDLERAPTRQLEPEEKMEEMVVEESQELTEPPEWMDELDSPELEDSAERMENQVPEELQDTQDLLVLPESTLMELLVVMVTVERTESPVFPAEVV